MPSPRKTSGRRSSKAAAPVSPKGRKKGPDPRQQGAPTYYLGDQKPKVATPAPLPDEDEAPD